MLQGKASTVVSCRETREFRDVPLFRGTTPNIRLWIGQSYVLDSKTVPMGESITSTLVDSFRCRIMKSRETCHEIDRVYPFYTPFQLTNDDTNAVSRF